MTVAVPERVRAVSARCQIPTACPLTVNDPDSGALCPVSRTSVVESHESGRVPNVC